MYRPGAALPPGVISFPSQPPAAIAIASSVAPPPPQIVQPVVPHPATAGLQQPQPPGGGGVGGAMRMNRMRKMCGICGDKSRGFHFGGISCDSCKAFFRRSVRGNIFPDYHCSFGGHCSITVSNRKMCQFCRFQKCLEIGMEMQWVLNDYEVAKERQAKRKSVLELPEYDRNSNVSSGSGMTSAGAYLAQGESGEGSVSSPQSPASEQNYEASAPRHQSASPTVGVSVDVASSLVAVCPGRQGHLSSSSSIDNGRGAGLESDAASEASAGSPPVIIPRASPSPDRHAFLDSLSETDVNKIENLVGNYWRSMEEVEVPEELVRELHRSDETGESGESPPDWLLPTMIVVDAKRISSFVKTLDGFVRLNRDDQIRLLKDATLEMILLQNCLPSLNEDADVKGAASPMDRICFEMREKIKVYRGEFSAMLPLDFAETDRQFAQSMAELCLEDATVVLLSVICLFSPDRPELEEKAEVAQRQEEFALLLRRHVFSYYPDAARLYPRLLTKLGDLRSLAEEHSKNTLQGGGGGTEGGGRRRGSTVVGDGGGISGSYSSSGFSSHSSSPMSGVTTSTSGADSSADSKSAVVALNRSSPAPQPQTTSSFPSYSLIKTKEASASFSARPPSPVPKSPSPRVSQLAAPQTLGLIRPPLATVRFPSAVPGPPQIVREPSAVLAVSPALLLKQQPPPVPLQQLQAVRKPTTPPVSVSVASLPSIQYSQYTHQHPHLRKTLFGHYPPATATAASRDATPPPPKLLALSSSSGEIVARAPPPFLQIKATVPSQNLSILASATPTSVGEERGPLE